MRTPSTAHADSRKRTAQEFQIIFCEEPATALRPKLYFPALTAMRYDPRSKAFAERLRAAGKSPMQVVFAVLHKLIRTAFALLKSSADYNPHHTLFTTS